MTMSWDGDRAPFAKAFIAAQRATDAIARASTNPVFQYKYADLATVVEAVVPALNACGIGVIQCPALEGELIHVETMLLHESGASVTSILSLRPSQLDPQGVGSAITYARRYALLAMTGAAPQDDDAAEACLRPPSPQTAKGTRPRPNPLGVISKEQMAELSALMAEREVGETKILKWLDISDLASLPANRFADARRAIVAQKKEAA